MSAVMQTAPVANVIAIDEIELTVLSDMRLAIYPQEIARAGEHNSAVFRIVSQPATLDGLPCRAEIKTADGSTFHVLVTNGTFRLTNDITKHGVGTIQLVYADATVSHKTQQAQYWVAPSVNAVNESDPEYQDGLAQLSNAAFAGAGTVGTLLVFVNIYGREVARITFPGSGLDEETANTLYQRLDGTNRMTGSISFSGPDRGIIFDYNGIAPVIYSDATSLRFRKATGNADITIEDASGILATRSAIITQATGDARYVVLASVNQTIAGIKTFNNYVRSLAIDVPTSQDLVTRAAGDNRYAQITYVNGRFIPIDGGILVGPITAAYDATAPGLTALVTRSFVEAYVYGQGYLRTAGGQMDGILSMAPNQRLISAMGVGGSPMLCIGSNDSGFWRTGSSLVLEMGFQTSAIFSPNGNTFYGPVSLPAAVPTLATQATTKQYVDQRFAPSLKFDIPVDFPLSNTWQNLYTIAYPIPRGGLSRVRVSVSASVRSATQGGLGVVGISCQPDIELDRIERHAFVYNLTGVSTGFTAEFFVEVNGAAPILTLQATTLMTNPVTNDIVILGGDTFNIQRSQILIEDLGAR